MFDFLKICFGENLEDIILLKHGSVRKDEIKWVLVVLSLAALLLCNWKVALWKLFKLEEDFSRSV